MLSISSHLSPFLAVQPLLVESLPKSFCQRIKVNIFDRCGTLTQGKIKNRMLLVRNLRFASLVAASQPIKSSRGAHFQAAEPKRRQAKGLCSRSKTRYFRFSPTVLTETKDNGTGKARHWKRPRRPVPCNQLDIYRFKDARENRQ
jgi:hypothetical protein